MERIDASQIDTASAPTPRVLIAAATGQGGVSETVSRVIPYLSNIQRIDVSPFPSALFSVARSRYDILHLHPSLRSRALLRDNMLSQIAFARWRRVIFQWHGWDAALRVPPAMREGLHVILTETQREALLAAGLESAQIVSTINPYDPAALPDEPQRRADSIVFLGRWTQDKGIELLIAAIAALPGLHCIIAGDGPSRASINAAILRHRCADRVSLRGWLDSAGRKELWQRASVLVLPSASESYPLVVVEALAAGVPVVATSTGAIPSLIDGAGRLVERSAEAIADGIRAILASPPPQRAAVQAEIVRSHHPREVARRWTEFYRIAAE